MEKIKVLVTVKTYPQVSRKYDEVVCTAGLRESGSWVRIYPLPFRKLEDYRKLRKFTWIELPLRRRAEDGRPESFSCPDLDQIEILDFVGTNADWHTRKQLVLQNGRVHTNMTELIEQCRHDNTSLATFRPTEIVDLQMEWLPEHERKHDPEVLAIIEARQRQGDLFEPMVKELKLMPKLPVRFKFIFLDDDGKESRMAIEDWEASQLFLNYWQHKKASEEEAFAKVREMYFENLAKTADLHFFLGTTLRNHFRAPNPFTITGAFYPPVTKQQEFDLGI